MQLMRTGCNLQPARPQQVQQLSPLSRRHVRLTPLCAAKKGKQQAGKRGKPASRPAPGPAQQPAGEQPPVGAAIQQQPQQQQQPPQPTAAAPQPQQQQQQPKSTAAAAQPQQQQPQQQSQPEQRMQKRGQQQVAETPQVVVDRMFKRVITFAGLPVLTGIALFPAFWYLRVVQKVEYPIWVVYVTQALMFGGGLLGITYGILSTSWDPRREGTALGWTELQANLPILLNKNKDQQDQ